MVHCKKKYNFKSVSYLERAKSFKISQKTYYEFSWFKKYHICGKKSDLWDKIAIRN